MGIVEEREEWGRGMTPRRGGPRKRGIARRGDHLSIIIVQYVAQEAGFGVLKFWTFFGAGGSCLYFLVFWGFCRFDAET